MSRHYPIASPFVVVLFVFWNGQRLPGVVAARRKVTDYGA